MAVHRTKSIDDLIVQRHRMAREYGNNPRNKYGGAADKAMQKEVRRRLENGNQTARIVTESMDAFEKDGRGVDPTTTKASESNIVQRLYAMQRFGNKQAAKALTKQFPTREESAVTLRNNNVAAKASGGEG